MNRPECPAEQLDLADREENRSGGSVDRGIDVVKMNRLAGLQQWSMLRVQNQPLDSG